MFMSTSLGLKNTRTKFDVTLQIPSSIKMFNIRHLEVIRLLDFHWFHNSLSVEHIIVDPFTF